MDKMGKIHNYNIIFWVIEADDSGLQKYNDSLSDFSTQTFKFNVTHIYIFM